MAVARSTRPTRVTRGSCSTACTGPTVTLRVGHHRAKLQRLESPPAPPDAPLREENGPAAVHADRGGDHHPERRGHQQTRAGEREIERPFRDGIDPRHHSGSRAPTTDREWRGSRTVASIERSKSPDGVAAREDGFGAPPAVVAERPAKRDVVGEPRQRLGQRPRIARRNDDPGHAVLIDPRHARRQIRADDRHAGRHRLDLDETVGFAFGNRRQHEHVAGVVVGRQLVVRHVAGEHDSRTETERGDLPTQLAAERPVANQNQRPRTARHRLDQHVEALVVHEASDKQHARPRRFRANAGRDGLLRRAERPVPRKIDAVGNHRHSPCAANQGGTRREHGIGHDDAVGAPVEGPLQASVGGYRPPRAHEITVVPDDEARRGGMQEQRRSGHRVWLVQHDAVGTLAPEQRWQRRTQRDRRRHADRRSPARRERHRDAPRPYASRRWPRPPRRPSRRPSLPTASGRRPPCRRGPADRTWRRARSS